MPYPYADDDFGSDGEGVYPENALSADEGKGAQLMKSALLCTDTRAAARLLCLVPVNGARVPNGGGTSGTISERCNDRRDLKKEREKLPLFFGS